MLCLVQSSVVGIFLVLNSLPLHLVMVGGLFALYALHINML